MSLNCRQLGRLAIVPLVLSATALGGCGGVQFEGRAFNAMGLGKKDAQVEKKMTDRSPLIVPPEATLPPPGPRDQVAQPQNWPQDPEGVEKRKVAAADAKKREYYEKGDWSKDRDIDEFDKLSDPLARRPGLISGEKVGDAYRSDGPQDGSGDSTISGRDN